MYKPVLCISGGGGTRSISLRPPVIQHVQKFQNFRRTCSLRQARRMRWCLRKPHPHGADVLAGHTGSI